MQQELKGRYCLVTGANSGIGKQIALGLLKMGGHVTMLCRDPSRGRSALEEIRGQSGSSEAELIIADLSSQQQVRAAAQDRRDRLTLESLRNFQSRDFAEQMQYVMSHDLPANNNQLELPRFSRQLRACVLGNAQVLLLEVNRALVSQS